MKTTTNLNNGAVLTVTYNKSFAGSDELKYWINYNGQCFTSGHEDFFKYIRVGLLLKALQSCVDLYKQDVRVM